MASPATPAAVGRLCINDVLTDDELRAVLSKLLSEEERDLFGLVCKRLLHLQSSERRRLRSRAGPLMLRRMAERFPGIVELDLSQSASRSFYPGVTDADLAVVAGGFTNLKILWLQECKGITDAGMTTIGNGLRSLQSVDVSSCKRITDRGLTALSQCCPNLRTLHLSNCKIITDGLLQALSKNCPQLEDLGLFGCNKITDSGLSFLVGGCRRIKSLDVSKCIKVGDAGVLRISGVCSTSLRTMKLLDCNKVGDDSILSLADSCKNLETLSIGGCHTVSDGSIKSLAIACGASLQNLRMDWCPNLSDLALGCILATCQNLVALDISCCERVTDSSFYALSQANFTSGLKVLKASNCSRITVSAVALLLKYCTSLEYLDVSSCPHITKLSCDQAGLQFPKCCRVKFSWNLSRIRCFCGCVLLDPEV